jgi:DedD protein
MFKKRKSGDESMATPAQAESIEAIRRRARHRLIGATVLVLIGVVAFPLLFDTQPRPIAVDIPIEIPDRNKVKPLTLPAPAATGKVAPAPVVAAPKVAATTPAASEPAARPADRPMAAAKVEPAAEPKPESKAEAGLEARPEARAAAAPKPDDGARARALLEGERAAAAESGGRFVVQVGAFADADKAREARLKVEKAGLKTYTHVAETREGKRIRVRAGPFGSRAEADKAAEKIKGLDLPAAILTL